MMKVFHGVAFSLFFVLGGLLAYWALVDNVKPAAHLDAYVADDSTLPGDTITLKYAIVREPGTRCSATVAGEIQDSEGARVATRFLRYAGAKRRNIVGKVDLASSRVKIPEELAVGDIVIRTEVRFYCNPWHYLVSPLFTVYSVCVPALGRGGCDPKKYPTEIYGNGRMYRWEGAYSR